jgi:hypothetical protein
MLGILAAGIIGGAISQSVRGGLFGFGGPKIPKEVTESLNYILDTNYKGSNGEFSRWDTFYNNLLRIHNNLNNKDQLSQFARAAIRAYDTEFDDIYKSLSESVNDKNDIENIKEKLAIVIDYLRKN